MPSRRIRSVVAGVALTGLAFYTSAAAAGAAAADTPSSSPAAAATADAHWLSGVSASSTVADFEAWIGHPIALDSVWAGSATWAEMTNVGWLPTSRQFRGTLSIGINMLPTEDSSATLQHCAAGDYDHYYATMGTTLQAMGDGTSFIRLGWEMNGDWTPWFIGKASPATWIGCWRHEVSALRSTDGGARIVWNANSHSSGEVAGKALAYYPGNDYVDVIGVDYYDMWPALNSPAAWNAQYNAEESDGMPAGLGSWLAFAKRHGMKLAVPEWGAETGQGGGADDPYYITAMFHFFASNASNIAYEAYFDSGTAHEISGRPAPTAVPKAAAAYRSLWGGSALPSASPAGMSTAAPAAPAVSSAGHATKHQLPKARHHRTKRQPAHARRLRRRQQLRAHNA